MSQAAALNPEDFQYLNERLALVSQHVARDTVIVALSFKAGLRIAEIAGLTWKDVSNPRGGLSQDFVNVPNNIAKKGSGRQVPMHPAVFQALQTYRQVLGVDTTGVKTPIIRPHDPRFPHNPLAPLYVSAAVEPNTLQRYISRLYTRCGLVGVTSHSGRRTALTALSRIANTHECSLRDVQAFAGHKFIDTTQTYIERSKNVRAMVEAL